MDYGLKIEHLAGYQPTWAHFQQYVVGEVRPDGSLRLLYNLYPPATGPVDDESLLGSFIVFSPNPNSQGCGLADLAEVWRHSSQHHERTLKLYSLRDLGLVEKP